MQVPVGIRLEDDGPSLLVALSSALVELSRQELSLWTTYTAEDSWLDLGEFLPGASKDQILTFMIVSVSSP